MQIFPFSSIPLGLFPVQASCSVLSSRSQVSHASTSCWRPKPERRAAAPASASAPRLHGPSLGRARGGRSLRHPHGPPGLRIRFQTKKLFVLGHKYENQLGRVFLTLPELQPWVTLCLKGAKELCHGWGCVGLEMRVSACKFTLAGNCPHLYVCLVWKDLLHPTSYQNAK